MKIKPSDPLSREMYKAAVILQEMYDNGIITKKEMILTAMEEGLKIAQCINKNKPYVCQFTW